jgi:hypothetical protein
MMQRTSDLKGFAGERATFEDHCSLSCELLTIKFEAPVILAVNIEMNGV